MFKYFSLKSLNWAVFSPFYGLLPFLFVNIFWAVIQKEGMPYYWFVHIIFSLGWVYLFSQIVSHSVFWFKPVLGFLSRIINVLSLISFAVYWKTGHFFNVELGTILINSNWTESTQYVGYLLNDAEGYFFLFLCVFSLINNSFCIHWLTKPNKVPVKDTWKGTVFVLSIIIMVSFIPDYKKSSDYLDFAVSRGVSSLTTANISTYGKATATRSQYAIELFLFRQWPFNLFYETYQASILKKAQELVLKENKNVNLPLKPFADKVVLVIGESSGKQFWQLYNPDLNTNPILSKEKNLILYKNVIAQGNYTAISVPFLMYGKNPFSSKETINETMIDNRLSYEQKNEIRPFSSILDLYKKAGYTTYWISNQAQFGGLNDSISLIAKTADQSVFFNGYDENAIPIFEKTISLNQKQFIIIHLMGSHVDYQKRLPPDWKRYYKDQPYLDTIRYTDYVLHQLINKLNSNKAILTYTSDHGQSVIGENKPFSPPYCKKGHGFFAKSIQEVPFFIWYSPLLEKDNHEFKKQLQKNQNKTLGHMGFFLENLKWLGFGNGWGDTTQRFLYTDTQEYIIDYDKIKKWSQTTGWADVLNNNSCGEFF